MWTMNTMFLGTEPRSWPPDLSESSPGVSEGHQNHWRGRIPHVGQSKDGGLSYSFGPELNSSVCSPGNRGRGLPSCPPP